MLEYVWYQGAKGVQFGFENLPKMYATMMKLKDGEAEKFQQLREEDLWKIVNWRMA